MKIAALTMVTLFVIYFAYNMSRDIVADGVLKSGSVGERGGVLILAILPSILSLASLVYLWTFL